MGVDYSAVLYLGKIFDGQEEVIEFIQDYYSLTEEDLSQIKEDGIGEWLNYYCKNINLCGIEAQQLNYYTSANSSTFLLGIDILSAVRDPKWFQDSIENAIDNWTSAFPGANHSIIAEVKVY